MKRILIILILTSCLSCYAQTTFNMRIVPGISLGYAFGRGIMANADLCISPIEYKVHGMYSYSGVHLSYTVFTNEMEVYEKGYFRAWSLNLMNVINNQYISRIGIAATWLKWGLNNVNTAKSKGIGLNLDFGYAPFRNYPYIGFRYYKNPNVCLGLRAKNPHFLYVGYQKDFIFRNSGVVIN